LTGDASNSILSYHSDAGGGADKKYSVAGPTELPLMAGFHPASRKVIQADCRCQVVLFWKYSLRT